MRSLLLFNLYAIVVWAFVSYCSGAGMQRVNAFPGDIPIKDREHQSRADEQSILNTVQVFVQDTNRRLTLDGTYNYLSGHVCYPQDVAAQPAGGSYTGTTVHLPRDYL